EMMEPWGGFDHNAQSLRIVSVLEQRYAEFDGLNLTWETLEGVVKHNGPLIGGGIDRQLPAAIAGYVRVHDLELDTHAGAEAQIASLADDIAYNNHDIDDGLRAGLFGIDDLAEVPLVGPMFASVRARYPDIGPSRLIHESVRRLIGHMVDDLIAETRRRVAEMRPASAHEVRRAGRPLAAFSAAMQDNDRALKAFLRERMYRHYKLNRMTSKARRLVKDLFRLFLNEPECLPTEWRQRTDGCASLRTARVVADYIAGMTDRFAADEHRRLFDVQSRSS
ncbi:MAG TPA: dNTP triphosphohydrolase, partial [Rhodospirillales bacterium]|nr:dNTP triphosphohydrolase [Rhodospirillales bacterium]